jgi:HK97 family phage major capsid protein
VDAELNRLTEAFRAKDAELQALLKTLGPPGENDKRPEEFSKAQGLRDEMKALQAQIVKHKALIELSRDAAALHSFFADPAPIDPDDPDAPPVPGADADTKQRGKVRVLGSYFAGDATIDRKTLEVLDEQGEGIFGEKAWKAALEPEYKRAFSSYLRKGQGGLTYRERKTLESGLDPQGGFLAPAQMIASLIARRPTPTRVAGMVQTIRTSRDALVMPKLNYSDGTDLYTTGFRVTNTGEKPASDTEHRVNDADLFGEIRVDVYTFMMSTVLTKDIAEDAAIDPMAFLEDKFRETIDLHRDNMILNGNGRTEPVGLLLNAGAADPAQPPVVLSGVSGGIGYDGLVDLVSDVPEQYEENLRFLFNKRSTYRALLKLKDQNNRPILSRGTADAGLAGPRAQDILGYAFNFSGFMPNIGASNYPILFGDFRGYTVADRIGFSLQVLTEKYAERNQVGIVGRVRFGGRTLEPWRLRVLKSNNT